VGKLWEYFFYIDLAGSSEEAQVKNALSNLGEFTTFLRVLGSYPRYRG
jgi:prephenate dehydratase